MNDELYHYGTPRHSGRYPWGSGENPYQHESGFLSSYKSLKDQGLSEKEIAEYFGMSTTELRQRKSYEKAQQKAAEYAYVIELTNQGYSNVAIAEKIGKSEGYVRLLKNPANMERSQVTNNIANELKKAVEESKYIDVGEGTNINLHVSQEKLNTAVQKLKDEGYEVQEIYIEQAGNPGKFTTVKVLCPPGTSKSEVLANKEQITYIGDVYSPDGGKTILGIEPPSSIDSSRIMVRYKEDHGNDMDGVIQLRRGVDDLSLGEASYAQVRIAVDGTHYLKGMALYSDDMPPGVDVIFNTNKSNTVPMTAGKGEKAVLKELKIDKSTGEIDKDNPFGTTLRMEDGKIVGQSHYIDKNGKEQLSPINIVRQEGDWDTWSRTLATQFLAKQPVQLIKQQLKKTFADKKDEYEIINSITQPEVKIQLLKEFAENCDSAASELKVAALPRQAAKVILPLTKLSDNEVYAPGYENGESVALVRYPHGGIFEIPILKVNNRNPQGKSILGNAIDAIGINPKVANQLSGADFDGDTVVVIPTKNQQIKNSKPLSGLANFDPKESYPAVPGMKIMKNTQNEMGKISNLITDMTAKGASESELARAVRHSMVVIDAEKHKLNYKQSYIDNGIKELKETYQGGPNKGASTLFSKAGAEIRVPVRRTTINKQTGELEYEYEKVKNKTYPKAVRDKSGNVVGYKEIQRTTTSTWMKETKDAKKLSSGTLKENIYADYANSLKAMANSARKEAFSIQRTKKNATAEKTYAKEVESLNSKLNIANMNKPKERKAQIMANVTIRAKIKSNPDMDKDQIKKLKTQALIAERSRAGASKKDHTIPVTEKEWAAIQAGAFSSSRTSQILANMNKDRLKQLAVPKDSKLISASKIARIRALDSNGYTIKEIADSVGVSVSTVNEYIKGGSK